MREVNWTGSEYDGVSKRFRTGRLEQELQMVQLSATRCSCIIILWVSLVNPAAITLCVTSQRVIPKVGVYFVMTQSGNFWIHPGRCRRSYKLANRKDILSDYINRIFWHSWETAQKGPCTIQLGYLTTLCQLRRLCSIGWDMGGSSPGKR
jgi:hypothetical protein